MIPVEAIEAVSDEAFKAAQDTYMEVLTDLRLKEGGGFKVVSQNRRALRAALEAAAPHMRPDRKSMADVLAAHQVDVGNRGMKSRCTCGWLGQVFGNDFRKDFITHQADMLDVELRLPDAR